MYSLSASPASAVGSLMNWLGFFLNAMKNNPPSSVPVCGSMPPGWRYCRAGWGVGAGAPGSRRGRPGGQATMITMGTR
jgi:hypothetical protein